MAEGSGAIARRGKSPTEAGAAVRRLESMPRRLLVPMDDGIVPDDARFAADLGLRGVDAIYVALAARRG